MLIVSVFAFFVVIFLLATITVAIAWMAFLKRQAEGEPQSEPANPTRKRTPADRALQRR